MANGRFEMFEYRQVLVRMRLGDSELSLSKAGLTGHHKARALRNLARYGAGSIRTRPCRKMPCFRWQYISHSGGWRRSPALNLIVNE